MFSQLVYYCEKDEQANFCENFNVFFASFRYFAHFRN